MFDTLQCMSSRSASPPKNKPAIRARSPARAAAVAGAPIETAFGEVVELIHAARQRAAQAVNAELIDLYWRIAPVLAPQNRG